MIEFSPMVWLGIGAITAAATLATLYALALRMRNELVITSLQHEARRMRQLYEERLAKQQAGSGDSEDPDLSDVIILSDEEAMEQPRIAA